jgi:hypothetical protein
MLCREELDLWKSKTQSTNPCTCWSIVNLSVIVLFCISWSSIISVVLYIDLSREYSMHYIFVNAHKNLTDIILYNEY